MAADDALRLRRARDAGKGRVVRRDDVRRRLALVATAVYHRPIPITTAEAPNRGTLAGWFSLFGPWHIRRATVLPATDGERIQLPREIRSANIEAALAEYRLM